MTGDITLEIPANTNADVDARVMAGNVSSDFPLSQTSPGRMHGSIGAGGPLLSLETMAGDIRLQRKD